MAPCTRSTGAACRCCCRGRARDRPYGAPIQPRLRKRSARVARSRSANETKYQEVCMTITSFATPVGSSLLGVLVLVTTWSLPVMAQHDHANAVAATNQSSELVRIVREATERFKDPAVADA